MTPPHSLGIFEYMAAFVVLLTIAFVPIIASGEETIRAGIIGCDTSHVPAFTKMFNDLNAEEPLAGVRVVAAFPGGSQDIPKSRDRVEGYTEGLRSTGIEIIDTVESLVKKVDVVLLMSIDGRTHLEQLRPVFRAGKPVYIDKPFAGSLADALAIVELAKQYNVPFFSSSSLRYEPDIIGARSNPEIGGVEGCVAFSPCKLEPTHPDLFWYGVHGVEVLYTVMGPGCKSVTRAHTDGTDLVTGIWKDGRLGTFRGQRTGPHNYGALIFGLKSTKYVGTYGGYKPLVMQIAQFFKTRNPPVKAEETLEMFAFMEAADESKRQGGVPVSIESVIAKAKAELADRP